METIAIETDPTLHDGMCHICERGSHDEDDHGEPSKREILQSKVHSPDEEHSISAEESLVSSLSGNTPSPRTFPSIAIQMSTLQASFAEKTAEEMKQIVDWYSFNSKEDLFNKVTQSQAFPDNPLVCLDDDHNGTATSQQQCRHDPKQGDLDCKNTDCSTPKSNEAISSDDDQSTDCLPDLAISPSSVDSPQANKVYTSSLEAQKQHQQVQDLVEATKYMAHVIVEYDHRLSVSDKFTTPIQESAIRRRRQPRAGMLTVQSPQKVKLRQHKRFLVGQNRTRQNWVVAVVVATLLGSVAWYCGSKIHPCNEKELQHGQSTRSIRNIWTTTTDSSDQCRNSS